MTSPDRHPAHSPSGQPETSTVILNPVINGPYAEPRFHFELDAKGRPTGKILAGRRRSTYFVPVAKSKKSSPKTGLQCLFDDLEENLKREENAFINQVRDEVDRWRAKGWPGTTRITQQLLEHWNHDYRERRPFFCQLEAAETAIWISEVAGKEGKAWVEADLQKVNAAHNQGLPRVALKMATGAGKTTVMAMLITWQTLNKQANPQDRRFTNAFLVVAPGITIRDRLRVLLPNDPNCIYADKAMDLVPLDLRPLMQHARVEIANYHQFILKEKDGAAKKTKEILAQGGPSSFTESPDEMVRRVVRNLGSGKEIMVLNDEAHHCYLPKPQEGNTKLKGEEKKEAEQRDADARLWSSGLLAIYNKVGIKRVFDLSATPFFLSGSGYGEGKLFPWVVSDFSLMDAIESGIVKAPRLPIDDNSLANEQPTYRNLWPLIRDDLPKGNRKAYDTDSDPVLPKELEGALQTLYGNYEKRFKAWEKGEAHKGKTPPVFIVVCNNTAVSKLVFDYIAGREKPLPNGQTVKVPGKLPLFSNIKDEQWRTQPYALLVDSQEFESGDGLSADFKKAAAQEIEEFKAEYRQRFPERSLDSLTEADLLREVMNTVGKPGKLGEQIRCVVSVSMLTEGWDTNSVTHILGVRAFGTQLLCEQVMGRGLRRSSYRTVKQSIEVNGQAIEIEAFPVEYAEILGIPFDFVSYQGTGPQPPPVEVTNVRALPERSPLEIRFPRIRGYRWEVPTEQLQAEFGPEHRYAISTQYLPTRTENAPIVGVSENLTLSRIEGLREQQVAFKIAKLILEQHFPSIEIGEDGCELRQGVKAHLFPQVLTIVRRWMKECVQLKDDTFLQELWLDEFARQAADQVFTAVVGSTQGQKRLLPVPRPFDVWGSTFAVDFDTTKPVYLTNPERCHVSHVVGDTDRWEQKVAQALEELPDIVLCYVKNHGLGFSIPYLWQGKERQYFPDFIAVLNDGHEGAPLNLILEVTGQTRDEKKVKVATARDLWVPAVNNHGSFGRWAFLEIQDADLAKATLTDFLQHPDSELVGTPMLAQLQD